MAYPGLSYRVHVTTSVLLRAQNTHARTHVYASAYYVRVIASRRALQSRLSLDKETSVKIIKNEVGCRDDTVPKTVDTRRHCNNLPQPYPYILAFGGCGRLLHALTPPRSAFLYL